MPELSRCRSSSARRYTSVVDEVYIPRGMGALTVVAGWLRRNVVALVALFIALGGTSYAVTGQMDSSNGRLYACVTHKFGTLNLTRASAVCPRGEAKISWNRTGRPGLRGAQGPRGAKGSTGVAGPRGATGPTGPRGTEGPAGSRGPTGPKGDPGPSTGPAGGSLTGSFPDPGLAAGTVDTPNFASGATAPNAGELGGIGPAGYLTAGTAIVTHGSANLSGVITPSQVTTPLGTIAGLGSFAVGGAGAQAGDDCQVTFTNTSGGPVSVNGNANPGLANGGSVELTGADARPDGASATFSIVTPGSTVTASGVVTVTFGFPGAGNVVCAGSVNGLIGR
jgi:hypothetical protein